MSSYDFIIGHQRLIKQIEKARAQNLVAHAYLFHGPNGVGKEKVAFAFVQALNCFDQPNAPCGKCESCRKIAEHKHPDVRLLASEAELVERKLILKPPYAPSVQIKNVQVDELAPLFHHQPWLGTWRAIVVVDAEKMNINCQNRLLKTLEEPQTNSVIILVSAHPNLLLPTIRSRCQTLGFGPLARDEVSAFLVERYGVTPDNAYTLAAMTQGSLRRAQELVDQDFITVRNNTLNKLNQILQGDISDVISVASTVGDGHIGRENVRTTLDLAEMWCRDLLFCKFSISKKLLINQDQYETLKYIAEQLDATELVRWMENIRSIRVNLHVNANPRMAQEALLLPLSRERFFKF